MDENFDIDQALIEKAKQRDFIKTQIEVKRQKRIADILICFKNGICPRCGDEQIMSENGYRNGYITIFRCAKCKLNFLDGD